MIGHGYCCGARAVDHPVDLISVCFHCGRFYDNQTWAERGPLGLTPPATKDTPQEPPPRRRVFTNAE